MALWMARYQLAHFGLEKDSSIKGSAIAEKVVIGGNIDSNVYGNSVKLKSSANVQSEVISNSLSVDEE